MIWKIETITDNDQPVAKKIFKNIREMVKSLKPSKRVSQPKIYRITQLIDSAEKQHRQGKYKDARNNLRIAYSKLDKMNCQRSSESSSFQTHGENKKSWSENHLEKSLSEILKK